MKRFMTIVSALSILVVASSAFAGQYGWTLSNSSTDPLSNNGAPTGGLATLFLWYVCDNDLGISAAEFDLDTVPLAAPTVANGWINLATQPFQWLAIIGQCPSGPMVAASILYIDAAGINVCIVPSADNGFNISVDCDQNPYAHDFIGYDSTGGGPCLQGDAPDLCFTDSVASESWGDIKALYR